MQRFQNGKALGDYTNRGNDSNENTGRPRQGIP